MALEYSKGRDMCEQLPMTKNKRKEKEKKRKGREKKRRKRRANFSSLV